MKTRLFSLSRLTLILSFVLVATLTSNALAQDSSASRGQNRMAVIDVKYILDVRFQHAMKNLKQRFENVSQELNAEREQIFTMQKRLNSLNANTLEYNQLQEQIIRAKADFAVKAEKHKREFHNIEGHILWNIYQEIRLNTEAYCKNNGIGLVIQFDGEKVDGNRPTEVFQAITRPIVYNARDLDITAPILRALNN